MSGSICGFVLAHSGISAVLLERGQIAGGSTLANTGILQFSNDIMLCDLIRQIGREDALAFYKACKNAIEQFITIANRLPVSIDIKRRSSLCYASSEQEIPKLKEEYETLRKFGFDVEYWDADTVGERFPFRKPGAIVTRGDLEVNPFRFVNALVADAAGAGLQAFEHTDITQHETTSSGIHILHTANGYTIEAEHVIYAVGYEPEELRGKLIKADLNRSFVIVTGVQPDLSVWHQRFFIWETARPYLYLRTTADNRVIAGGLDEEPEQPIQSERERRKRSDKLYEQLTGLFPGLTAPIEYEWSATFGESLDNLPFIGVDPAWNNVYYCLGYGGNGSVYSMIAAHLLRDLIAGEHNPIAEIVKLDRASLAGGFKQ